MKSQPVSHSETCRPSIIKGILIRVGEILSGFMVMGATLFMAAGRVNWAWGWIMLGIYLASVGVNGIFMLRRSPETIAERGQPGEMKSWDRLIGGLWGAAQYILVPPDLSHPSMRAWLAELPKGRGRAAAFETRLWWSPGGATGKILSGLAAAGYTALTRAGRFIVKGAYGPLKEGELDRARQWGAELARLMG